MENGGFIVNSTPFMVGDAKFTFFRLYDTHAPKNRSHKIVLHCHLYYEIRIAVKGTYEYSLKNKSVALCEGEMLIIPPSRYHYSRIPDESYTEYVLALGIEKTDGAERVYDSFKKLLDEKSESAINTTPELVNYVSEYLKTAYDGIGREFDILCREHILAANIVRELSKCLSYGESVEKASTKAEDMAVLLELLTSTYDITLAEIAGHMNYSVRHTSRLIKELYGKTYAELVKTRRLEAAKKLLADTDLPVNIITERVGYNSESAFYRDIKACEGKTPAEYRSIARKKEDHE